MPAEMEESETHTASTASSLSISQSERNWLTAYEGPPADDCCPICFASFSSPFRGPCGHWYCVISCKGSVDCVLTTSLIVTIMHLISYDGTYDSSIFFSHCGCIMEYWNHVAAFRPCKCPMCSRPITKLTPESTLYQQQDAGTREILKSVRQYNCLFAGGACGVILQVLQLPLFVKRLLQAMMDPDQPVAYLSRLRLVAVLIGALYTLSPFDFLPRWRYLDAIDLFDCSAIALSFSLYFVGLYSQRRRLRHLRQLAPVPRS